MSKIIDNAVNYGIMIANDDRHGYSQGQRWGPDFDCSSLVITCFQNAGIDVKGAGATYTGNMKSAFLQRGFEDVTKSVNLKTGAGIKKGDVCLNIKNHVVLAATDNGTQLVNASLNEFGGIFGGKTGDQTGREIHIRGWYNYPWDCILRYTGVSTAALTTPPKHPASGAIAVVQQWLQNAYNPQLVIDGIAGPITRGTIVRAVQKEIGVKDDGFFGSKSKAAFPTLRTGSTGNLVKLVAAMLICKGQPVKTGLTDTYNADFAKDIRAYQAAQKIKVDGLCGQETAQKLFR